MTDKTSFNPETLAPKQRAEIEKIEADVLQNMKKDAANLFDVGKSLFQASEILSEPEMRSWLSDRFDMTDRHGRNYVAVHRNLETYRERCIACSIGPTVLFKLAHAEPEKIETVIAKFENGGRLKVREVTDLIKSTDKPDAEPPAPEDRGGLAGLRAYGTDELRSRVKAFDELCRGMFAECVIALEPSTRGKSVSKKTLKEAIQLDARLAYRYLETTVYRIFVPDLWDGTRGYLSLLEPREDSGWGKVARALYQLGGVDGISVKELPDLLTNEVLPALRWALGISEDEQQALLEKAAKTAQIAASRKARAKKAAAAEKRKAQSDVEVFDGASRKKPKTNAKLGVNGAGPIGDANVPSADDDHDTSPVPRKKRTASPPRLTVVENTGSIA